MNNNKTVFFAIGILLIILGAFMFMPFIVQLIFDEENSTFISSASITVFIGILLVLANSQEDKKLNMHIWYDENTYLWVKAAFEKTGYWEYRLKTYK